MDSKNLVYYSGLLLVAAATFVFVMYILPSLPPFIGVFVYIGLLALIALGYGLRFRRLRRIPADIQTNSQSPTNQTTEDFIQQVEELMKK